MMGTSKPSFAASFVAKYSFELFELDLSTTVPFEKDDGDEDEDDEEEKQFNISPHV